MSNQSRHLDDDALQMLIFSDEDSPVLTKATAHVETCDDCLTRLQSLADDEGLNREATELLSGYHSDRVGETAIGRSSHSTTPSVEFLSPPSHPEMLGRLGRYDIERIIGSGGMGVVLKGFDTELNRPVAVKVLARHLAHSGAARQRFAREAKAAAAVVHEHVVAIHNVETEADDPFLVMQYVHGESLQARVDREGPLDAKQILRIGIQAAAGLAAAHAQGVMHRDVKPANILLEHGVERVLITDFGLARTVDDASLTHTGIIAGTPSYMSPEQAGGEASDHRTDLFSLGAVLYFMATGHPPFRAERAMGVLHRICNERHRPVWEVNADIPDDVCEVIDCLLQKKPSRRVASASALRDQLTKTLENLQYPRRWGTRRLRRMVMRNAKVIGGMVLSALLVAVVMLWPSERLPNSVEGTAPPLSASGEQNVAELPGKDSASNPGKGTEARIVVSPKLSATALDQSFTELQQRVQAVPSLSGHQFDVPVQDSFPNDVKSLNQRLMEFDNRTSQFEYF